MPKINEAVKSNIRYRTSGPMVETNYPKVSIPSSLPPLVTFQPPTSLPVRGVLPPNLINGTDFYLGVQQFRSNMRSSVMLPPSSVSKQNTPQSLLNKKLVSPVVGGGTPLNRYNSITAQISPQAVAANATVTQSFTVKGVSGADKLLGYQWNNAQTVGVNVIAVRVTGDNTLAIDFSNSTAGALTPTGGGITLFLVR